MAAAASASPTKRPTPPPAARALDWLGDLRAATTIAPAPRPPTRAPIASRDPEGHRLAARGLGDLAVDDAAPSCAARPLPRGARRRRRRAGARAGPEDRATRAPAPARRSPSGPAWALIVAALAYFLARSRAWQRRGWALPTEALYVVPIYAADRRRRPRARPGCAARAVAVRRLVARAHRRRRAGRAPPAAARGSAASRTSALLVVGQPARCSTRCATAPASSTASSSPSRPEHRRTASARVGPRRRYRARFRVAR